MPGYSFLRSVRKHKAIGVRVGGMYRYRFDQVWVIALPRELRGDGFVFHELGARFEAYADVIRYKRAFLRARAAYNLFSFSNTRKHPNQAELMGTIGISLGKKR